MEGQSTVHCALHEGAQGGLPVPDSKEVLPVMRISKGRRDFQPHFENIYCH